ncbi:hypothetical protein BC834DRAFT_974898 [Gloeopeniophorella convolvens]|nr:hypothetical protein BC834DRAFT_974898 [Gloeopeniophorella convolvens]
MGLHYLALKVLLIALGELVKAFLKAIMLVSEKGGGGEFFPSTVVYIDIGVETDITRESLVLIVQQITNAFVLTHATKGFQ